MIFAVYILCNFLVKMSKPLSNDAKVCIIMEGAFTLDQSILSIVSDFKRGRAEFPLHNSPLAICNPQGVEVYETIESLLPHA
jgi:hypothetical protein